MGHTQTPFQTSKSDPGDCEKKGPTHTKSIWPVGLRRHHTPQSMMPSACAPAPPHHNVGRTRSAPAAAKKKRPNLFDLGGILFLTTLCLGEGGLHHQCSLPRQTRATRKRTCTSRFRVGPFFRSPRTPKVTIPKPTTTQIDMLCTVSLHPLFVFKFVFGFFEGVLS